MPYIRTLFVALSVVGMCSIVRAQSTDQVVRLLKEKGALVDVSDGKILWVDFRGGESGDAELALLSSQTDLEILGIGGCAVTDFGVRQLTGLRRLDSFKATNTELTDDSVAPLISRNPELHALWLSGTKIGDKSVDEIARLKKLRGLYLSTTKVTRAGLLKLAAVKTLADLELASLPVDDEVIKHYGDFKELYQLDVGSTEVTDNGVKALASCSKLTNVILANTRVGDEGIASLEKCPLEVVDLSRTAVTDRTMRTLAAKASLRFLSVVKTEVSVLAVLEFRKKRPDVRLFAP